MKSIEWIDRLISEKKLPSDRQAALMLGMTRGAISHHRVGKATTLDDEVAYKLEELLELPHGKIVCDQKAEQAKDPNVSAMWRKLASSAATIFIALSIGWAALTPVGAEASTVNHWVAGSSPAGGAIIKGLALKALALFYCALYIAYTFRWGTKFAMRSAPNEITFNSAFAQPKIILLVRSRSFCKILESLIAIVFAGVLLKKNRCSINRNLMGALGMLISSIYAASSLRVRSAIIANKTAMTLNMSRCILICEYACYQTKCSKLYSCPYKLLIFMLHLNNPRRYAFCLAMETCLMPWSSSHLRWKIDRMNRCAYFNANH